MSPTYQPGTPALYNYQSVRYYPFDVPPGAQLILTADPWSFLYGWLSKKSIAKRGKNQRCLARATYYAELAQGFYESAETSRLPAKGTLTYYGMLNLVKCLLSVRGVELENTLEHHGLTVPLDTTRTVKISAKSDTGLSIFPEFASALGTPATHPSQITIKNLLCHIPEIHQITFSMGLLPWARCKFLPVKIKFFVNETKSKLFTEIHYEKKEETRVEVSLFTKGPRASYFVNLGENNGSTIFRSNPRKTLNKKNWPRIYRNVLKDYSNFHIVSMLTRNGYMHYCDLRPGDFHHLCYTFIFMFYLGSIARYRPTEMTELIKSEYRPLVTEAIATCPKQFLYHLVSHITESVCVVPMAALG